MQRPFFFCYRKMSKDYYRKEMEMKSKGEQNE